MICELIAFGCLIAHGDIKATRSGKFTGKYQADFFVKALSNLHPDFYPKPMFPVPGQEPIPTQVGAILLSPAPRTSGFLTKSDLTTLYHACGERMHRGAGAGCAAAGGDVLRRAGRDRAYAHCRRILRRGRRRQCEAVAASRLYRI